MRLLLGGGGLLFGSPLLNDTIVFHGALGAIANLFASWIVSHRRKRMRVSPRNGKEVLPGYLVDLLFHKYFIAENNPA